MRTRVASIVTLFTLVLLGFLLVHSCSILATENNRDHRDTLYLACQATSATLEGESFEGRKEALAAYNLRDKDIVVGLYNANGSVSFASDGSKLPLTEEDFNRVREDSVNIYTRKNAEGKEAYYAIYQFEDGAFLLYSRTLMTGLQVMAGNGMLLTIGAIVVVLLAYILITLNAASRKEELGHRVIDALDSMAEGKFDARIEPLGGKSQEVEVYNAALGRVQGRMLKQSSRNHALNLVINQMQNGIIAVDESLKVILVTPVAKKLLGIIGSPEGKHINEASRDVKLDSAFTEAMGQAGVYITEVAARVSVGRGHRPLRLYMSPMLNEGHVVGALAMVEDITEIRRLEQVRTDFAANVSHELKTPLTSIRGFVETLENGAIDNPEMAHKFLRIIMMETERLTRLINDILSISKLESGNDEVTIERLRLDKMAYDVADMLSIHAAEKEVTINCHMNSEPVMIMGNSDRIEQMLINLVENAIKYNKPGGSVTVQVFSNDMEANIAISDTGIGIAEENLPRLFERFYRVDKGRSRQMGGTGLGLAIVKHIIRSMNGEIEVHSKLGEGTEFLITLPLAPKELQNKETIFNDDEP